MTHDELLALIEKAKRDGQTHLDLSERTIRELPAEIGQLINLEELNLSANQLSALPPEIGQLAKLQMLNLSGNQLSTLPPEIGQLAKLQTLNLDNTRLSALPPETGQLAKLEELHLAGNQLSALPPEIGQLAKLQTLNLDYNQLSALPPEIGRLTELRILSLSTNQLSALPPEIDRLTRLRSLYLDDNQLSALPPDIGQLKNLAKLYLHGNEALEIPPEILGQTWLESRPDEKSVKPADILDYYFRTRSETTRPLNEAKVLLVGQGGVGKTSLVKRLVDDTFDPKEAKTEGINIRRTETPAKGDDGGAVRVNIWDFGGQEIMHATHQFFLTKRSVYLLVLDARKGANEGNIHYWLQIIQSYGGDSPVLIVINQNEPPNHLDLDETRLRLDYAPNVRGFFQTSCELGTGIPELKAAIEEQIHDLPHVYDRVPASYFSVKEKLEAEAETRDYLDISEYRRMCVEYGIADEKSQNRLIRFLHDLGNVLNFDDPDDPYRLRETNILNPEWVTDGVYKILNSFTVAQEQRGVLNAGQLGDVLADPQRYPPQRQRFVVDMMRRFELCFAFPDSREKRFLIPELLTPNEPELNWDVEDALNFQYQYKVLPEGVMPRFIVRAHDKLTDRPTYWRSGVVLEIDGCKTLVRGDTNTGRVYISIRGKVPARRRNALSVVRDAFRQIHATIPKLGAEERVPLPDNASVTVGYQHLLDIEEDGTEQFRPEGASRRYSVQELLNGIEDKETRLRNLEQRLEREPDKRPIKAPKPTSPATQRPDLIRPVLMMVVIFGGLALLLSFLGAIDFTLVVVIGILLAIVVLFTAGVFGEKARESLAEKILDKLPNLKLR